MRELIYKRAAIDAMCDNCDTLNADCAHYPCSRYVAVEELPSAQQWIPCSERLPAEGEPVLLCDRGGCMTLGRLVRTDEGCKWDICTWWSDIEDGDAWMPLPEPYKGEDNG